MCRQCKINVQVKLMSYMHNTVDNGDVLHKLTHEAKGIMPWKHEHCAHIKWFKRIK